MKYFIPLWLAGFLFLPGAASASDRCDDAEVPESLVRSVQRLGASGNEYAVARHDLNQDGVAEALVFLTGQDQCGSGGCPLLVLRPAGNSWHLVTRISIVKPPIRALARRHDGWESIGVKVSGGGIVQPYEAVLDFGRKGYPTNPTVPPAHPSRTAIDGVVLISGYRCSGQASAP